MTFKEWSKSSLEVDFEDGTTILEVTYKSSNRELINKVLHLKLDDHTPHNFKFDYSHIIYVWVSFSSSLRTLKQNS